VGAVREPVDDRLRESGATMRTEINIANADQDGRNYLTWAPVRPTIKLMEPETADPVDVVIGNEDRSQGGQLEFGTARDQPLAATLNLTLPADGSEVGFFVAGDFGKPSSADGDAAVKAALPGAAVALSTKAVKVRIRKNANDLSPAERDRFTTAPPRSTTRASWMRRVTSRPRSRACNGSPRRCCCPRPPTPHGRLWRRAPCDPGRRGRSVPAMSTRVSEPRIYVMPVVREIPPPWEAERPRPPVIPGRSG
jgi:hypothetical protein